MVRVQIRAELTVAERCRRGRDAVLPTLAWGPEGWGCEGGIETPSRPAHERHMLLSGQRCL